VQQKYVISLPLGVKLILSSDTEEALDHLRLVQFKLSNKKPLLQQATTILRLDAREQFAEGGNPAWKPLAPSTLAAKQAAGLPAKLNSGRTPRRLMQNGGFGGATSILIASGGLRDSWATKSGKGHFERVNEASGTAEIGSSLPIAIFHQLGTRPYPISPKAGRVLSFMGAGGRIFTRKTIHHPGLAARPVVVTDSAREKLIKATEEYFGADPSDQAEASKYRSTE
jgi:phage gpG-like protein